MSILPNVISLATSVVLIFLTYKINTSLKKKDEETNTAELKSQAIADGVQCLLRDSIVRDFNKYSEKGFCPIYAKETIKRAYAAYKALDGNDVAKELYTKILEMPEEEK